MTGGIMNKLALLAAVLGLLFSARVCAQDAMQYGLKHLQVLAEDGKVRVLKYSPERGNKTPVHSHPSTVLYVVKGGKVRITMPDGSTSDAELKSGTALLRPPVTHSDEALDDLEVILIEMKNQ
jgi:quercetin dioxygenase-like cupin family protein